MTKTARRAVGLGAIGLVLSGGAVAAGCSGGDDPPASDIVTADVPPPPISGGTLAISAAANTAIAADPDRDVVWLVGLDAGHAVREVALDEGDEPGRVAVDEAGHAFVALRRGGAVATIDLVSAKVARRDAVCAAPRGLAFDAASKLLHVACAGGELVTLGAGGHEVRRLRLGADLRDVVVDGDRLLVTRFRSAETLTVEHDGTVSGTEALPDDASGTMQPEVAWRAIPAPGGGLYVAHQRAMMTTVFVGAQYYSATGCDPAIVQSVVSRVGGGGAHAGNTCAHPIGVVGAPLDPACDPCVAEICTYQASCCEGVWDQTCAGAASSFCASPEFAPPPGAIGPTLALSALPVDVALSPDESKLAVAMAGSAKVVELPADPSSWPPDCYQPSDPGEQLPGQPIAVAFTKSGTLVTQLREPAMLLVGDDEVKLPGASRFDTGHAMFHTPPSGKGAIACASCHPEGGDDGHVWHFDPSGTRRTQSLRGGILKTAPFHWAGDLPDMTALMGEVFTKRMGGATQGPRHVRAMARYIDAIPEVPAAPPEDSAAIARGQKLFEDPAVGCASCHSGAMLTNDDTVDVGTGEKLQVPTLRGLALRAPYLHDGCAKTLADRFGGTCGGGDQHGHTSQLTQPQIADLVAYLDSL